MPLKQDTILLDSNYSLKVSIRYIILLIPKITNTHVNHIFYILDKGMLIFYSKACRKAYDLFSVYQFF
jgi:hypothetical protein